MRRALRYPRKISINSASSDTKFIPRGTTRSYRAPGFTSLPQAVLLYSLLFSSALVAYLGGAPAVHRHRPGVRLRSGGRLLRRAARGLPPAQRTPASRGARRCAGENGREAGAARHRGGLRACDRGAGVARLPYYFTPDIRRTVGLIRITSAMAAAKVKAATVPNRVGSGTEL